MYIYHYNILYRVIISTVNIHYMKKDQRFCKYLLLRNLKSLKNNIFIIILLKFLFFE